MVCEYCKGEMKPGTRGPKRRFCNDSCRLNYHNEAAKKGKALIERRAKKEGHPIDLNATPVSDRGNLLGGIARKLGLTEGPLLKELRRQKAAGEPLTPPTDGNQYEIEAEPTAVGAR